MLRDLATAESCGQENALSGFANSIGKQGQQIADAKQFSGMRPGMSQWRQGAPNSATMMNAAQPGAASEMNAFAARFREGMPQIVPQMNRAQTLPVRNQMVSEFAAMNLQRQQSSNFERAFAATSKPPVQTLHHQKSGPVVQRKSVQRPEMTMQQYAPMMQMPMMPMMASIPMTSSLGGVGQQVNVPSANEVQNLFAGVQAPKTDLKSTPIEAQPETEQRPMGGMGLNPEMIEKLMNSKNPRWRNSKFMKFLNKVQKGEIEFKDNQVIYTKKSTTDNKTEAKSSPGEEDIGEAWATEFANASQGIHSEGMHQWKQQFEQDFTPPVAAQPEAKQKNPYLKKGQDNGEAFRKGLALMKDGNLKEAIQAFEADVTYHPEHAEGWRYLGQCHADEEEERPAIAALLKCLDCDPYNLPALLMLGVSYTNDLEEGRALKYLKTWLENNPEYSSLAEVKRHSATIRQYEKSYSSSDASKVDTTLSDEVMHMFLAALKANPNDPELHTVVGVLQHLNDNYTEAITHFRTGTSLKPNDPYLWNKLGATQANSSRSQLAVEAYQKALALKPNYMRARTNLAIAYANQGIHDKACIHYLKALRQNEDAYHVWGYLKISLSAMGRTDLLPLVNDRSLSGFSSHFKF
ncbi:hypothetical protein AAMO2058_000347500 [Amorphochlora amoebiformis]